MLVVLVVCLSILPWSAYLLQFTCKGNGKSGHVSSITSIPYICREIFGIWYFKTWRAKVFWIQLCFALAQPSHSVIAKIFRMVWLDKLGVCRCKCFPTMSLDFPLIIPVWSKPVIVWKPKKIQHAFLKQLQMQR